MEMANFAGFSQMDALVTVRGSIARPTAATASTASISPAVAVSGASICHARSRRPPAAPFRRFRPAAVAPTPTNVAIVHIIMHLVVDSVNINGYDGLE